MANVNPANQRPTLRIGGGLKRRGLLAGVAAIGVTVLSKLTAKVAEAANGENLQVGNTAVVGVGQQTSTTTTAVSMLSANVNDAALFGAATSQGLGVGGFSTNTAGVFGSTAANNTGAVVGFSENGAGVLGRSVNNAGLSGISTNNLGVVGTSGNTAAFYGFSSSTTTAACVVEGPSGGGVSGSSNTKVGVSGKSQTNIGVAGISTSSVGVYGTSSSGFAGQFDGPVRINGDFEATGMKSALVPLHDGTSALVYCMESPDSWFEDFGFGNIRNGRGIIQIDGEFAQIVDLDSEYHVFLTALADCQGLFVAERKGRQIVVQELASGRSTARFSYRIVAKRRDIAAPRLKRKPGHQAKSIPEHRSLPEAPKPLRVPDMRGNGR